jgi:hypothetical protein
MHDGGMGAEGDDVVVRQFFLAGAGGPAISQMNLVLGGAGAEFRLGGPMGANPGRGRMRHALDFIGGLGRTGIIQSIHKGRRIVIAETLGRGSRLAQQGPAALRAHLPPQFVGGADHDQIE